MTPTEVRARTAEVLGGGGEAADAFGMVVVDVDRSGWLQAATAVRDDAVLACTFFDLLTAVDEGDAGFHVVLHLWSPAGRHGLLLRTSCPADDAWVPSLAGVFAGADWQEREMWEMFAIDVRGHPGLRPLLLPDGFDGHPLRKDFVLASRVAKEWPGIKEPT